MQPYNRKRKLTIDTNLHLASSLSGSYSTTPSRTYSLDQYIAMSTSGFTNFSPLRTIPTSTNPIFDIRTSSSQLTLPPLTSMSTYELGLPLNRPVHLEPLLPRQPIPIVSNNPLLRPPQMGTCLTPEFLSIINAYRANPVQNASQLNLLQQRTNILPPNLVQHRPNIIHPVPQPIYIPTTRLSAPVTTSASDWYHRIPVIGGYPDLLRTYGAGSLAPIKNVDAAGVVHLSNIPVFAPPPVQAPAEPLQGIRERPRSNVDAISYEEAVELIARANTQLGDRKELLKEFDQWLQSKNLNKKTTLQELFHTSIEYQFMGKSIKERAQLKLTNFMALSEDRKMAVLEACRARLERDKGKNDYGNDKIKKSKVKES